MPKAVISIHGGTNHCGDMLSYEDIPKKGTLHPMLGVWLTSSGPVNSFPIELLHFINPTAARGCARCPNCSQTFGILAANI